MVLTVLSSEQGQIQIKAVAAHFGGSAAARGLRGEGAEPHSGGHQPVSLFLPEPVLD